MKISVFILLLCAVLIFSCEKSNIEGKFKSKGTITGMDYRMCPSPACGGYFIQIDSTQYRFDKNSLPGNFTFDDYKLPLKVELDWELDTVIYKGYNWINISKIKAIP